MLGQELMGGIGKTMTQSGSTFGTFTAIGTGTDANEGSACLLHLYFPIHFNP